MRFMFLVLFVSSFMSCDHVLTATFDDDEKKTKIQTEGVTLSQTSARIVQGTTEQLTAYLDPPGAESQLAWSAANESVARVSQTGLITGIQPGSTEITVTTEYGEHQATCAVEVYIQTIPVLAVSLNKHETTIVEGITEQLNAIVYPANATDQTLEWATTSDTVAVVNPAGHVTGRGRGSASITVTTADGGYQDTCTVSVLPLHQPVTGVRLNKSSTTIIEGGSETLRASIDPPNAYNQNITWESSNTSIAEVSDTGQVTGNSPGTAAITVTTEDGDYHDSCEVEIYSSTIPVMAIGLTEHNIAMMSTVTHQLESTVYPSSATNQNITWSSSNASIARVNPSGLVTGGNTGTATITVTTEDGGHHDSCAFQIIPWRQVVTGVSLDASRLSLLNGTSAQLNASIQPANATNLNVTWSSSNTSIAGVSQSGLITGNNPGTATVTVTTRDGGHTDTCDVTVTGLYVTDFPDATAPGQKVAVTAGTQSFDMIYVNNTTGVPFPILDDDSGTASLEHEVFLSETEVTNALVVQVYQWARNNRRFSTNVSNHNGLNSTTAKYGGQELLDLDDDGCRINYSGSTFTIDSGYANYPCHSISWYGMLMFCNWLTEMIYGDTDNLVYTGIDTTWTVSETQIHYTREGYRLPRETEWEYAARYRGSDTTYTVPGYTNPCFTRGDTASGGYTSWDDTSDVNPANGFPDNKDSYDRVAVYWGYLIELSSDWGETGVSVPQTVATKLPNTLGFYDMSGNVWEATTSPYANIEDFFITKGYHAGGHTANLCIGRNSYFGPNWTFWGVGFRLAKTK